MRDPTSMLPGQMIEALAAIINQVMSLEQQIRELDGCLKQQLRASEV